MEPSRPALTVLSEDERLFRDSVYEFADREIRPLVREMDEHARIPPALIDKLFGLGVMAIEIPEVARRRGRDLLPLRPRGRSAVARRPGCRRARRRPQHAGHQRADAMGQRRDPATLSPAAGIPCDRRVRAVGSRLGQRRVRDDDPGGRARRRLGIDRPEALDHQRQRGGRLHRVCQRQSGGRLPRDHGVSGRARIRGLQRGQEGRQAGHPREQHLRAGARRVPRAARKCHR